MFSDKQEKVSNKTLMKIEYAGNGRNLLVGRLWQTNIMRVLGIILNDS